MKPTVIRIVDDDSDVCDSLSCLLSLEGWEIRIYTDPKEFLAGDLLTSASRRPTGWRCRRF